MTREELKEHCKKQIEMCEMWAHNKGEEPNGKVYEEHKLILELLEQQPCENVIVVNKNLCDSCATKGCIFQSGIVRNRCNFYKAESEEING